MKVNFSCTTNGKGLWTTIARTIPVSKLELDGFELLVFFSKKGWPETGDLIYTDPQFLKDLRSNLVRLGFSQAAANDIDYSECGMQGENYVSFDAGDIFCREWRK